MQIRWKPLGLLAVLVVVILFALLLAVFFWQATTIRKQSEYHRYHYDVSISAPALLANCTLLLPVPSIRNNSPPGDALVRGEGYNVPPGWMLSLEPVNGTPMLRISAPAIVAEYHGYPIPIEPGSTQSLTPAPAATAWSEETPVLIPIGFGVSLTVPEPIDTRDPFGREPLLAPPESYIAAGCRGPSDKGQCYRFSVPVSVSCSSGEGNLTLSISAGGTNQWWMGGWSGNSCDETVIATVDDPRQGWVAGEGFLTTGTGRYS
jgi:hypothetical protein